MSGGEGEKEEGENVEGRWIRKRRGRMGFYVSILFRV